MCEKTHIDFPDEDWPYDHFPEDDGECDNSIFEEDVREQMEPLDNILFDPDDYHDQFPEEGDWEDEEEVSIMNGG